MEMLNDFFISILNGTSFWFWAFLFVTYVFPLFVIMAVNTHADDDTVVSLAVFQLFANIMFIATMLPSHYVFPTRFCVFLIPYILYTCIFVYINYMKKRRQE